MVLYLSYRYANLTMQSSDVTGLVGSITEQISVLIKGVPTRCQHVSFGKIGSRETTMALTILHFFTDRFIIFRGTEVIARELEAANYHPDRFDRCVA